LSGAFETDVEIVVADHLIEPGDGGEPGISDRLSVSSTESFHEFAQTRVRHHRQGRAGVSRGDRGAAFAFEDDHPFARLRQQIRRAKTGHTSTARSRGSSWPSRSFHFSGQFRHAAHARALMMNAKPSECS